MLLTVALIAALSFWDAERQSDATLEDFAQEQVTLASSVAMGLGNRLQSARRDALLAAEQTLLGQPISTRLLEPYLGLRVVLSAEVPAGHRENEDGILISVPVDSARRIDLRVSIPYLFADLHQLARKSALVFLLAPPGDSACPTFYTIDDKRLSSARLCKAIAEGQTSVVVPRQEAGQFGLPARMALMGLSQIDGGVLGTWHVAAISSALRQRDRSKRARLQAVLGVFVGSGLVLLFGGIALYLQRKEREMEQALFIADLRRQRDEKLVRASKAATLGTLALGIAHELSTPLGVIAGRAEQLKNRLSGDERTLRSLDAILEQSNHISQIIRGFLSLVRGHHPPTEPLAPAEVVRGAVLLCEHRFAKAGVQLIATEAPELPLIRGDLRLLEHALVNLLLNACDACEEGGQVEITTAKEEDLITFSVVDNGVGISPADAERVLEPFFTTKPAEEGTGLGLAIAQEIVKHHRGELHLSPAEGGGTWARVQIPIWQGEAHGD